MNKEEENISAQFILAITITKIEKINAPLDKVLEGINKILNSAKEEIRSNKSYNILSSNSIKDIKNLVLTK